MSKNKARRDDLRARIDDIICRRKVDAHFLSSKSMDEILEEISIYHQELEYQNNELMRIREELEISQKHYYDLFNEAPVSYVLFSEDCRIETVNRAFSQLVGIEARELHLQPFYTIIHPECQDPFYFHVRDLLKHGLAESVQLVLRGKQHDIPVKIESNLQVDGNKVMIRSAIVDMSREKEVQQTLLAAKERAEEASRLKSQFLANMSHEIRTPMNGIMGFVQLLSTTVLHGEQDEFLKNIMISADGLLSVIDNILDISKIEAGKIVLEEIPYDLRVVVASSLIPLKAKAAEKNIVLSAQVSSEVPHRLMGDPTKLRQILTNLINNAVKFTTTGSVTVEVALLSSDEERVELQLTVQDTGIGIAAAASAAIFEPFVQADISSTRKYGGTGLGLAISKRLVEAMGGEIGVTSTEGEGSLFTVTLPQKREL